jgi:DNA-binding transcriptional ArsR family regulator
MNAQTHEQGAGAPGFMGSSRATREDVRGALYSSIGTLRLEADDAMKRLEPYLTGSSPIEEADLPRLREAYTIAARIVSKRLSGEDLARLYDLDQAANAEIVNQGLERRLLDLGRFVNLWVTFGTALAVEPASTITEESAYREAEAILFAEEDRRARLAALPRGMSCGEILSAEFPPPAWIVPGLLVSGLTILAGAPKLGKSWLALALGAAVGSGGAVLGRYRVERRGALYLALEDTPRRLKDRLEKIGAAHDARLDLFTQWRNGAEGIADLDAYLTENPTVKLVLVDTLARFRGAPSGDDRYAADYAAASAIKTVADRRDCAIVLIHHIRKMAAEDIMDTVSGSNGINGAADSTWVLTRARGEADASLFITGRDVEEQTLALRFDSVCGSWAVLGDAEDYAQTNERRAILRELEGGREAKSGELAKALGKSPQAISNRLRDLEREGLVRSPRYGVWAVVSRVSSESVKVAEVAEVAQPELTHLNDLHEVIAEPAPDATFPKAGRRRKSGEAVGVEWEDLGAEEALE